MIRFRVHAGAVASGFAAAALALGATLCATTSTRAVEAATDPAQPAFYTESVQPIFQANCFRCHGSLNHRGGFNMNSRAALLQGGHHGPALVPGLPEQSLLLKLIRHQGPADDPMNMPPDPKPKLSDADIAVVAAWIKAGAAMPATASAGAPAAGR